MSAVSSSRERIVARSAASRAMNGAVILPENGISLWPATATATTCTEYSVGTGIEKHVTPHTLRHYSAAAGPRLPAVSVKQRLSMFYS